MITIAHLRTAIDDESVDLIRIASGTYVLAEELYIRRNVTIVGEGPTVTLDAAASLQTPRRILRIAANASVEVHNLILTGAWTRQGSDPGGGAVANQGTLRMYWCTLTDNRAWSGSAIFSTGTLMLSQCIFSHNYAEGWNAAVYVYAGSTAEIRGCVFEYNENGGLDTHGLTLIEDTIFRNNSIPTEGAAIYNAHQLTLIRAQIIGNVAWDYNGVAGGIMNAGVDASLNMRD